MILKKTALSLLMATAVSYFICELQSVVHFQLLNPKNRWIIKIDTQDNRKLLYSKLY